ncbi:MAG: aminotransferase class I/II-fold pyridoxal phosphate-dependent enzyme [Bacillota bacterium]
MDYSKFISKRVETIKPSGIRKFFDVAKTMDGVISLGVGEPDFITPFEIRQAGISSIQKGRTQYTSNSGLDSLRENISRYLFERLDLSYDASEVFVTVGASEGIDIILRAIIDEGDEVLVCEPSYVSYAPVIQLCGGVAVAVPCYEKHSFKVQACDVEKLITNRTKAIVLPYPNNPTGGILEKAEAESIAKVCIDNDLLCISDEIYAELTYGKKHFSICSVEGMKERSVHLNGFSKAFAMTGWRIGFIACPKILLEQCLKIHQYTIMCASSASQYAADYALVSGFEDDFASVELMRDEYDKRRKYLFSEFTRLGFDVFLPEGAFYIFPSVEKFGMTGEEFCEKLLLAKKLAVVPGSAFGKSGEYNIRISYAYSMDSLKVAISRIEEFICEIKA